MKHKLTLADVATPERIQALEVPETDKAELLRLDAEMGRLAKQLPV